MEMHRIIKLWGDCSKTLSLGATVGYQCYQLGKRYWDLPISDTVSSWGLCNRSLQGEIQIPGTSVQDNTDMSLWFNSNKLQCLHQFFSLCNVFCVIFFLFSNT